MAARRAPTDVESIEQLVESARRYVAEGKAKSTRRAYRSNFAGFEGCCASCGLSSCPAPPATVAVYLAALADAGAAVATIEKTLAAIAHTNIISGRFTRSTIRRNSRRGGSECTGFISRRMPIGPITVVTRIANSECSMKRA
jgi:hypothetical protein